MFPVLFHVGSHPVGTYTALHLLGALAAVAITVVVARRLGMPARLLLVVTAATLVGVWVGARLGHAWFEPDGYRDDPSRLVALRFAGLSLYGGFVGGMVAGAVLARRLGLPLRPLADAAVIGGGVGVACVRCGCLGRGCCFGAATEVPWAVTFPDASPAWMAEAARRPVDLVLGVPIEAPAVHPTQVYEIVAALAAVGLAIWVLRRRAPAGVAALGAASVLVAGRAIAWTVRDSTSVLAGTGSLVAHLVLATLLALVALRWWASGTVVTDERPAEVPA